MRKGHCTISGMDDPRRRVEKSAKQGRTAADAPGGDAKEFNNKAIKFPGSKQRKYAKHI